MHNVFLVIKHEIASMLSKRSFWVMTFLFPILVLGLNVGVLSGTSAREDLAATADLIVADIGALPARPEFGTA